VSPPDPPEEIPPPVDAAATAPEPDVPAAPAPEPTPEELFDRLVATTGVDLSRPSWTDAMRQLHRHSRKARVQLIPEFFYTPVFSPAELPEEVWTATFPDCGNFDLEAQRAFLKETPSCTQEIATLPVEPVPGAESEFHWNNDQFSHADAALYYALIRRFRPRRIVEVGAGHSSKLALHALRENGAGEMLCIDPHPPAWLGSLAGPITIRQELVQDTPMAVFAALQPDDMLFIDNSHISKTGSDVNHLFLRVLPRLPPGLLVQIHDICLPYEYPRYWSEEWLLYWNEQYVLAALLANNPKLEVLLGVYFVARRDAKALAPFLPGLPGVLPGGGSLWLRSA
jgi:predicted O-methyltransferase YrrM